MKLLIILIFVLIRYTLGVDGNIINRFLIILLVTTLMNIPVSAQSGWSQGQTYEYQTSWFMSSELFDQNGVTVGSEYIYEEQDFAVKIYNINETDETMELFTLFDDTRRNYFPNRESVFNSRIEWKPLPNSYIGQNYASPDYTYLHSYNYNQSYFWFIPVLFSDRIDSQHYKYEIVFNSFNLVPDISYLFIDPDFKLINENIKSIIEDLDVIHLVPNMGLDRFYDKEEFTLGELADDIFATSFMGEQSLGQGIARLSSTTKEWSLSMNMMNSEFWAYQYSDSQGVTWHERVYEKYISSIELSYSDEGILESLSTKIEKISTGNNETINSVFEKSIFQKSGSDKIIEFYNENKQNISYLNGLLLAAIIILLAKKKIKMEGRE